MLLGKSRELSGCIIDDLDLQRVCDWALVRAEYLLDGGICHHVSGREGKSGTDMDTAAYVLPIFFF